MLSTIQNDPVSIGQKLALRANTILDVCSNFLVIDQASYSEADRKVSETASLEKGIIEYWSEPKRSAHKTWKGICQKEKDMLSPIEEGSKILSAKMATFKREFDLAQEILQPTTPQMVKALEAKIKKLAKLNGGKKIEGVEIISTQSARRRTI